MKEHRPMTVTAPGSNGDLGEEALKKQYLECLSGFSARATDTLRQVITALVGLGIGGEQLLQWAIAAGDNDKGVRSLLSQTLLDAGVRRRRTGAGPKIAQESLLIEAYARDLHGQRTLKYLRAACRVARANDEARNFNQQCQQTG